MDLTRLADEELDECDANKGMEVKKDEEEETPMITSPCRQPIMHLFHSSLYPVLYSIPVFIWCCI